MEIKVLAFGQISEITGKEFILEGYDITSFKRALFVKFPSLIDKKFEIAVNKKITVENIDLMQNDVIALMPPYSGG